ncbi:SirB1 family protein [Ideonella oryzae]|uniref:Tetratricopeptide repeat protein n=1 Tax=Ideonella oryzae TaxID=2937441 RepID=A0ABT1BKK0_9BURK|nr:tetratricopeptide repeat protein [Ideonella oryzae]MCO5976742.1 tetratricopeptide repeat protein [Ideonella oryzae]
MSLPMRFEAPSALEYFAALVAEDAHLPLLEAAALLGQDADPGLDVQAVLDEVDRLAQRFCGRLPADAAPLHRLRMLNRYFFHELGFGGNANNFYDPQNSYVHRVLETRRGIPVSLAVLYVELATQAGLPALGVSFPGHFLVKLHLPAGEVLLDPLDGRSLSREELEERLEPFCQQRGLVGDDAVPLGLFLQAASPRDILARMLGNLKSIHRTAGDPVSGLAVQERLVRLVPEAWEEWRDRGLLLAELGQCQRAVDDLALYLREVPEADDADGIRQQLRRLREQPPPRWH